MKARYCPCLYVYLAGKALLRYKLISWRPILQIPANQSVFPSPMSSTCTACRRATSRVWSRPTWRRRTRWASAPSASFTAAASECSAKSCARSWPAPVLWRRTAPRRRKPADGAPPSPRSISGALRSQVRQLIQPVDISLGAGFDHIGRSASPHHLPAALLKLRRNLAQRLRPAGYSPDLITHQLGGAFRDAGNRLAHGVHRTVANRRAFAHFAADAQPDGRRRNSRRPAVDMQIVKPVSLRGGMDLIVLDGDQVLVEYFLLLVRH